MRAPFERIDPTAPETPVIVEIPHAGIDVAAPFLEPLAAPARSIGRDADLYVDSLYAEAPAEGATVLVARASRYVIDLNRSEGDIDGEVVEGARGDVRLHHGLVWRTTSEGDPALTRRLSPAELDERLELVWRPYHRELAAAIERKRAQFGLAVVLAAHSMPSVDRAPRSARPDPNRREPGRTGALAGALPAPLAPLASVTRPTPGTAFGAAGPRADVVPGSRGRKSAGSAFIAAVEDHAVGRGWTVRHDDPYAGGYTTQHYGHPGQHVHAIQVELARRLYLDEETLRPLPSFDAVRGWCRALVAILADVAARESGRRGGFGAAGSR